MIKKTIIQYIFLLSLFSMAMGTIAATYVDYLISHGLNLFETNVVNLFYFTTLLICEVPTGAFADVFGRKTSFVCACFILSVGKFMYAFSNSFWSFAGAEVILAVGMTFANGAFKAWLVDKLKHHGHDEPLHKVFSKSQLWAKSCAVLSALAGSFLADKNIRYPFMVGGTIFFITGTIALFWLREEYFTRKKFSIALGLQSMKNTVTQSIEFGIKHSVVRFIILVGLIQVFAVQAPNMQWRPYFIDHLHSKHELGFVWFGMMAFMTFGSFIAPKLFSLVKDEKKCLIITQVATGLLIAIIVYLPFPVSIMIFMIHEMPRGIYDPIKDKLLHDNIPSDARATISSFESISPHLGGVIGLLCSGFIAEKFGIPASWTISGLFLVSATLILGRNGKVQK